MLSRFWFRLFTCHVQPPSPSLVTFSWQSWYLRSTGRCEIVMHVIPRREQVSYLGGGEGRRVGRATSSKEEAREGAGAGAGTASGVRCTHIRRSIIAETPLVHSSRIAN